MSTPATASSARNEARSVVPKLIDLSGKVLHADVWHTERVLADGVAKEER